MKLQLLKVREARTCMVEATKRQVSEKFCLEMCVLCVCVSKLWFTQPLKLSFKLLGN